VRLSQNERFTGVLVPLMARSLDRHIQPCGCRKSPLRCSSGMIVFVEEPAKPIVSADAQTCERGRIGDRFG
jgi:hypothetical protein